MNLEKLMKAFGNFDQILEGVKNNIFKEEHIEAVAKVRWQNCKICKHIDYVGTKCTAPGTQPCCIECGCSLAWKMRALSAECPIGRWKSYMTEELEEELLKNLEDENVEKVDEPNNR